MNHNLSRASGNSHLWIMLACCLVPLALILAIGVFGISLGSVTPLLPYAMILLCPLMMLFMTRGMAHNNGAGEMHHTDSPRTLPSTTQLKASVQPNAGEPSPFEQGHCH